MQPTHQPAAIMFCCACHLRFSAVQIVLSATRLPHSKQARYIVERSDSDLWLSVLGEDNKFRRQLIDQVSSALEGSRGKCPAPCDVR